MPTSVCAHRGHHRWGPHSRIGPRVRSGHEARDDVARDRVRARRPTAVSGSAETVTLHVQVGESRLQVRELVAEHDVGDAAHREQQVDLAGQPRSVRLRTTDIIGVMPMPPAISTTRSASWPAKTNLPAGAETLTRCASRQVSWRCCEP